MLLQNKFRHIAFLHDFFGNVIVHFLLRNMPQSCPYIRCPFLVVYLPTSVWVQKVACLAVLCKPAIFFVIVIPMYVSVFHGEQPTSVTAKDTIAIKRLSAIGYDYLLAILVKFFLLADGNTVFEMQWIVEPVVNDGRSVMESSTVEPISTYCLPG